MLAPRTREGIQDYQYLLMLKKLVNHLRESGQNDVLLKEAEALLATNATGVIDSIHGQYGTGYYAQLKNNPSAIA